MKCHAKPPGVAGNGLGQKTRGETKFNRGPGSVKGLRECLTLSLGRRERGCRAFFDLVPVQRVGQGIVPRGTIVSLSIESLCQRSIAGSETSSDAKRAYHPGD